ncbi:MAG TPA: DUF3634 family protein [Polyangiaceae bacterium]|jgi:hypothetical protein
MSLLFGLLILAVLAIPFGLALRRANELFCIQARAGRAELVRGRLPPRLLRDLADIVERSRLDGVRVRVVVEARKPRVLVSSVRKRAVPGGVVQRMRNVVGHYEVSQIRQAKRRR